MPVKNINLIVKKKEKLTFLKIKKYLPIFSFLIFLTSILSIIFSNYILTSHNKDYQFNINKLLLIQNSLKEKKDVVKNYYENQFLLSEIEKINKNKKSYSNLLKDIFSFNNENIELMTMRAEENDKITISFIASNSANLEDFILNIKSKYADQDIFKDVKSSNIVRDEFGKYYFSLNFIVNQKFLK